MKMRGETRSLPDAPERELVDATAFWAGAEVRMPGKTKSVHLRLDPEVFDYFQREGGGKGHITRMQAVLRAYVKAQQSITRTD